MVPFMLKLCSILASEGSRTFVRFLNGVGSCVACSVTLYSKARQDGGKTNPANRSVLDDGTHHILPSQAPGSNACIV